MKLICSLLVAASAANSAFSAFVPSINSHSIQRCRTELKGQFHPDSADAVKEAMRISEEFGKDSPEARIAWENVEEMDANDDSAAFTAGDMEHLPDTLPHETEYTSLVKNLSYLISETQQKLSQMKYLTNQLMDLELDDPTVTRLGSMSESLRRALAEAKAADDSFGPNSDKAAAAWDDVDGKAAGPHPTYRYNAKTLERHHLYEAVVDPQSLEAAVEAFGKIEHLGRLVTIEKSRIEGAKAEEEAKSL